MVPVVVEEVAEVATGLQLAQELAKPYSRESKTLATPLLDFHLADRNGV